MPLAAFGMSRGKTPTLTGNLHFARSAHQATLLIDGRVLVTGGSDATGKAIGPAEIFDPGAGAWSLTAVSLVPRLGHSAALLHDGRVIVVGGLPSTSSCEPIGSAELFNPSRCTAAMSEVRIQISDGLRDWQARFSRHLPGRPCPADPPACKHPEITPAAAPSPDRSGRHESQGRHPRKGRRRASPVGLRQRSGDRAD